ncbi:MAG: Ribose 5-phosphate isomerase A [uncultured Solirubrobacteraceae bacterium]|uniref:Ribose 5-phosphate isomerase A n=1 Tax=uncultured Solirubrobacteraceae bacterium TaxID=1162706 RepID=A0A6J4TRE4_9ACTN|nr:MAG: Ribose 5-phosphate isomerase A [uncultured Solirubrobacteraceae bacterium]
MSAESEKEAAARAAAALVRDGMTVGLGTGSTVKHFVIALAERGLRNLRCVATSPATEEQARGLGLPVEEFDRLERLDIAVDGADQIAPDGWIVKGGGGAHTREKIVAAASNRFVVIADASKVVDALRAPIPLEILPYGATATLAALHPALPRDAPPSPDGGLIADFHGDVSDPDALAARLSAMPGIVDHGLFPPSLTSDVIIARGGEIERRAR